MEQFSLCSPWPSNREACLCANDVCATQLTGHCCAQGWTTPQAWFSHFYLVGVAATFATLELHSRTGSALEHALQVPQVLRCTRLPS